MASSLLLNTQKIFNNSAKVSQRFQQMIGVTSRLLQASLKPAVMLVTTLLFVPIHANSNAQTLINNHQATEQTKAQREHYSQAKAQLQKSNLTAYKNLRQSLDSYPLAGHLDYLYHRQYINKLNHQKLESFAAAHNNLLLSNKLKRAWLQHLAKRKQWPTFIRYYDKALANSNMQCQHAWALYKTGEQQKQQQALQEAKALWMHSESRPKSCDAIFHVLIKTDHINSDLAWQRFILAFNDRQQKLAKYLVRLLDGQQLQDANRLLKLYRQPQKIVSQWQSVSRIPSEKINLLESKYQLLKKLARSHPQKARDFAVVINNKPEDKALAEKLISYLIQSKAIKGYATLPQDYIALGSPQDASSLQWLLRAYIAQANWQAVIETVEKLPAELKEHERWRYWYYRAKSLSGSLTNLEEQDNYRAVANKASFYGFTTAENLGLPYSFEPISHTPKPEHLELMRNNAYLQRAIEHFAQQEYAPARSEWRRGSQGFNTAMRIDSAYLARAIGWHHQAINSAAQAKAWQHYQLRFPNLFVDEFRAQFKEPFEKQATGALTGQAIAAGNSPRWPYAVARQESAFASDAQSSAGAMGLMQIKPSTAKEVARKQRIKYQRSKLFNADYNIVLGSAYLKQLNKRYQNRALTSAAYNAGPRRANNWLKNMEQPLPLDAWIEIIPFSETRQYVQNIFSFSLIHALLYNDASMNIVSQQKAEASNKKVVPFIYNHEQIIYPKNIRPAI